METISKVTVGQIVKFILSLLLNLAIILGSVLLNSILLFAGVGGVLHIIFWVCWFSWDDYGQRWTYDFFGKWQNLVAISVLIVDLTLVYLILQAFSLALRG